MAKYSKTSMLTVDEAAKVARCSSRTIRRALKSKELGFSQLRPNAPIYINYFHLCRWIVKDVREALTQFINSVT